MLLSHKVRSFSRLNPAEYFKFPQNQLPSSSNIHFAPNAKMPPLSSITTITPLPQPGKKKRKPENASCYSARGPIYFSKAVGSPLSSLPPYIIIARVYLQHALCTHPRRVRTEIKTKFLRLLHLALAQTQYQERKKKDPRNRTRDFSTIHTAGSMQQQRELEKGRRMRAMGIQRPEGAYNTQSRGREINSAKARALAPQRERESAIESKALYILLALFLLFREITRVLAHAWYTCCTIPPDGRAQGASALRGGGTFNRTPHPLAVPPHTS